MVEEPLPSILTLLIRDMPFSLYLEAKPRFSDQVYLRDNILKVESTRRRMVGRPGNVFTPPSMMSGMSIFTSVKHHRILLCS